MENQNIKIKATPGSAASLLLTCFVFLTSVSSLPADPAQSYHGTLTGGSVGT
jgi:hypothetical protein